MVKFQKQFERQIVPDWEDAYCNYKQLKGEVKRIKEHCEHSKLAIAGAAEGSPADDQGSNSHRGILKKVKKRFAAVSARLLNSNSQFLWIDVQDILVHLRQLAPVESGSETKNEFYETEVLRALIPRHLATNFFKILDAQLNMVNRFYKVKEDEYMMRAQTLQLRLVALLDSRRELARCKMNHSMKRIQGSTADLQSLDRNYDSNVSISVTEVLLAEKHLRSAFVDLYHGLGSLQNYSTWNMMAFTKILKKYDKVTGWSASMTYRKVVETSYFAGSLKMLHLMHTVEDVFTKHLAEKNHKHAMVYLKPEPLKSGDFVTVSYLQGFFTGCSVALFATLLITLLLPSTRLLREGPKASKATFQILLPVFSTAGLVLLHLYMYGWNMYLWGRARINYAHLFEWTPQSELRCHEVLLLSNALTTFWMLILVILKLYPDLPPAAFVPLLAFLVILVILFFPFNVCYRAARVVFLTCILHVLCSPFFKVGFADFFLADQLCSQITAIKNLQYMACYYLGGYFRSYKVESQSGSCTDGGLYRHIQYFVSMLPYWWRLMQCMRRWVDERDMKQMVNGGKYLSALIAALLKVAYVQTQGSMTPSFGVLYYLFIVSALISTIYNLYWDIVMDWGLLQSKSVNLWLRDRLIIKQKCVYYVSMVLNGLLRVAWLTALLHVPKKFRREMADILLAILEVFRRGQWNFYRLEYEHLNSFYRSNPDSELPFEDLESPITCQGRD